MSYIKFFPNGSKFYFNYENQFHNENGPALKCFDGSDVWLINNKCHRLDGPAIGDQWWIEGKRLYPEKEKLLNIWYENKSKGEK